MKSCSLLEKKTTKFFTSLIVTRFSEEILTGSKAIKRDDALIASIQLKKYLDNLRRDFPEEMVEIDEIIERRKQEAAKILQMMLKK